jgi:hypothetical protein
LFVHFRFNGKAPIKNNINRVVDLKQEREFNILAKFTLQDLKMVGIPNSQRLKKKKSILTVIEALTCFKYKKELYKMIHS